MREAKQLAKSLEGLTGKLSAESDSLKSALGSEKMLSNIIDMKVGELVTNTIHSIFHYIAISGQDNISHIAIANVARATASFCKDEEAVNTFSICMIGTFLAYKLVLVKCGDANSTLEDLRAVTLQYNDKRMQAVGVAREIFRLAKENK